ncbi:hypothetical protein [Propionimicrobium sp. PCR01-08-3]|uniref:hypothetical protein n=1 Tax=Propionimicrobium sp. PCR01-08-3 TaxID=3052086 RepID=UPI00255D0EAA|nr:hypothetical protein [Propionimicrobium sp. PCR01-08-3]WIY84254.1 hypothetical protein QQ658_11500 [Propionimicrobium sp. PCR01-08-3]
MAMNVGSYQLRAFCHLDRLQPQFAGFVGKIASGAPPVEGMSSLYVEMAPGNWVFQVMDKVLKSADVLPGAQDVERQFGMFEVHSMSQADVIRAGEVVLDCLDLPIESRVAPKIVSEQIITNVHPSQAQVMNRLQMGTMIEGGQTVLIMEIEPAAYVTIAANEAEKAAPVFLNQMNVLGMYGRMWMSGTESDIHAAREGAAQAINSIVGQ